MKINIRHIHVKATHVVDSWIEQSIFGLGPRMQVDQADVVLEHWRDESPAYQVKIHIVTPGPDIEVEARDHTLRAAIKKALHAVETRVSDRYLKREQRIKSNLQSPAITRSNRAN
jgi:ribosome-associated translation inhibitor RaiA